VPSSSQNRLIGLLAQKYVLLDYEVVVFRIMGGVVLAGCTTDHGTIYQTANRTVQRLVVGPIAEYESKTLPHALGAGGGTFGGTASQYRWVHVQGITKVDRDTWPHTIVRVPDQIPQLHKHDVVDVLFLTVSDSNYDQFKTPVVLRVVCKNEDAPCKRQLYKDAGNTNVFLGPTNAQAPDLSRYTFSKFYDTDGKILSGVKLPQ
jgi:hypothetical protein